MTALAVACSRLKRRKGTMSALAFTCQSLEQYKTGEDGALLTRIQSEDEDTRVALCNQNVMKSGQSCASSPW